MIEALVECLRKPPFQAYGLSVILFIGAAAGSSDAFIAGWVMLAAGLICETLENKI